MTTVPTPGINTVPPVPVAAAAVPQPVKVNIDVQQLSRDHTEAVRQIKEIQVLVTSFLDTILVRRNDEAEKETQVIKSTIQQVLAIQLKLDKLGSQYAKLRLNDICSLPCGNTGYVILDPTEEQTGFHKQLIQCYTWLKNLDQDCTRSLDILKLKSESFKGINKKVWKKTELSLQDLVQTVTSSYHQLIFNDAYLISESCLEIRLEKLFAVRVFFSGTCVSHIIVVSINEHMILKPWQTSEHVIYQKLSDVYNSVILKLIHNDPTTMLKEFISFVVGYKNIFEVKCKGCNKQLYAGSNGLDFLPPIWKDLNSKLFYHLHCR